MQQNTQPDFPQVLSTDRTRNTTSARSAFTILLILLLLACIAALFYSNARLVNTVQDLENQIAAVQTAPELIAEETVPTNDDQTVERIGECGEKSCLFRGADAVEGMGTVTGYYHTYQKADWGGVQVTCDALIVQEGSNELIDDLLSWVREGNGINAKTDEGKLILNIDLPEEYETEITSSTLLNPVTLTVVRHTPQPRGVGSCHSFVSIINAE